MDRIKRLSMEVLDKHKSRFGQDFSDNKKALDEVTIIRSKGLKNEIAGYITKHIKREVHDSELKRAQAAKEGQTVAEAEKVPEEPVKSSEGTTEYVQETAPEHSETPTDAPAETAPEHSETPTDAPAETAPEHSETPTDAPKSESEDRMI